VNGKSILVAWAFLLIGMGVFALLGVRYANDILFYLTAEKQRVRLQTVHSTVTMQTDPSHPSVFYEAEICVSMTTADGERAFCDHLSGSKRDIDSRIAELKEMLHSETWVHMSDRTPGHFATTLVFPTGRLYAMLIPLLVLILPLGFALYRHYSRERAKPVVG